MNQQNIPCPDCSTPIPFDTMQLLSGVKFQCPSCGAQIGLAQESKPLIEETMKKFEEVKKQIGKMEG